MPLVRPTARPLALAAALATTACGDDDGGPGEQLTGRYRLVSVENGSLPYPTSFGIGNTYYIVEGSLVFSGNQVTDARRYELVMDACAPFHGRQATRSGKRRISV